MRQIRATFAVALLPFVVALADLGWCQSGSVDPLSLEQKTKISQLIAKQSPPLGGDSFSLALGSVVPAGIEIRPLPPEDAARA